MKPFAPIFFLIFFFACKSQSPKISYNIPKEMEKVERKKLLVQLEHGKNLYLNYCANCHGIAGNGKDSVPNFSKQQFDSYKITVMTQPTPTHALARKMQPEDLMDVFVFLQHYKRK